MAAGGFPRVRPRDEGEREAPSVLGSRRTRRCDGKIARPAGTGAIAPKPLRLASRPRAIRGVASFPRVSTGPRVPRVGFCSVREAAAAARGGGGGGRGVAQPRGDARLRRRAEPKSGRVRADTRLSAKRGTQPATADLAPRTRTSETPLPAAASPPLVPRPRVGPPLPAEVAIARAHLDARLRASRSSPALMGLSRMGVASLETRGWTAPSAAAFELALREKKFSVFAVSRLGTGRKKPLDPPRREPVEPVEPVSHVTNDAAVEPPFEASVEPPSGESPDPRLAGKSFACMVEYYYNVLLTRPDAEDDDDDRSACDEEEFAAAPELERGGAKRRGARSTSAANASTGGVPRSASERELARLGVGERAPKKKKVVRPALTPAEASARVAELLRFTRHASVSAVAACAELSAAAEKARSIPRHGRSQDTDPADPAAAAAATPVSVARARRARRRRI